MGHTAWSTASIRSLRKSHGIYTEMAVSQSKGTGGVLTIRKENAWSDVEELRAPGAKTVTWHVFDKALASSLVYLLIPPLEGGKSVPTTKRFTVTPSFHRKATTMNHLPTLA